MYKEFITLPVIFSGLIAAIAWNLLTWWYGIPSSSSHTLIGGFAGAAVAHAFMSQGFMPLNEVIDSSKVLKTLAFIFLAPLIGMLISMFYTLVFINRNVWVKNGIMLVTMIGVWFMFIQFQKNKIDDNMEKFFKVDKLKHEVETDPSKKEKLERAKAYADACKPFSKDYESNGAEFVAEEIAQNVDLTEITTTRMEDKIKLFFKVEQLKIIAKKNPEKQIYADKAAAAVDSLKPIAKLHAKVGYDSMIAMMIAKVPIQPDQLPEFKEAVRIDIKKDIAKEMSKADNKVIRYGLMGMLLIIILSFVYTEQIKERSAHRTGNNFKRLQLLSSAAFSIGHGGNDAQKVMGIIAAALVANGNIVDIKTMPDWVPLSCYIAISLGTLSGGWKIVKTMGSKITKVTPIEGVAAETAGATTLFLTEQMGIPVSTTHTITGAIIGVGATKRLSAVRWGVTFNLLWAWILTIPVSAALAAITYAIVQLFM